jgi:hypothetical protein
MKALLTATFSTLLVFSAHAEDSDRLKAIDVDLAENLKMRKKGSGSKFRILRRAVLLRETGSVTGKTGNRLADITRLSPPRERGSRGLFRAAW